MSGKKWVLLVAGSKGWDNYRHQANVCCAYQLIKKHGIPDEQIVVMIYDDIANNPKNPFQGNIASVVPQMPNIYPGVPKDYSSVDVNPVNFLATLQGDDTTMKKIIRSGTNDNIFVYMSGTGGQGTFDFPEQSLGAADLIGAINNMHTAKKFSKMVICMDSDFSKSMFKDLSPLKNVYAVTSCDDNTQSYLSDRDPTRDVYLSDQFSSAWLKFIHMNDFSSATLKNQFDFITKYVQKPQCPPCNFGDMKLSECPLSEFLLN
ncbi:legumain-like [Carassius auratus]|uniref:Legumain-like n=1 Tax=Carassius auratus TaxID=7957 RepID=A0A6P6NZB0_CARAU|nr:legumain-like [Carassius auratus]